MNNYFNTKQGIRDLFDFIINMPIYFELDELKEIQASDDPFTYEEIFDLLDEELNRPDDEINREVVDFYLNILLG